MEYFVCVRGHSWIINAAYLVRDHAHIFYLAAVDNAMYYTTVYVCTDVVGNTNLDNENFNKFTQMRVVQLLKTKWKQYRRNFAVNKYRYNCKYSIKKFCYQDERYSTNIRDKQESNNIIQLRIRDEQFGKWKVSTFLFGFLKILVCITKKRYCKI